MMATKEEDEQVFGSTTFEWRQVKIKRRPQGTSTAGAQRRRWRGLARYPRAQALRGIEVQWRGGAESWWLIKARGSHGVFPGHLALEDVMAAIFNEPRQE
jgi:hypothetical protein